MSSDKVNIIKRGGQRPSELFCQDKLQASVRAACLSVRSPEGQADMTANRVCQAVCQWLETKSEVTSHDLRRKASESLDSFHPEAAYLYKHHRLVI